MRGLPVTFFPALPPDNRLHATDFYLTQVGAPLGAKPRIPISSRPSGIVAIHPFSGSAKKNWPLESFADLAQTLDAEWCEGPKPLQYRFTDLGKLAEWVAGASVYIGNDSGITHLAAAVGTPVVALFGPTDPRVWAPRADPLRLLTANPLDNLTVAEVIAAANQIRSIS